MQPPALLTFCVLDCVLAGLTGEDAFEFQCKTLMLMATQSVRLLRLVGSINNSKSADLGKINYSSRQKRMQSANEDLQLISGVLQHAMALNGSVCMHIQLCMTFACTVQLLMMHNQLCMAFACIITACKTLS